MEEIPSIDTLWGTSLEGALERITGWSNELIKEERLVRAAIEGIHEALESILVDLTFEYTKSHLLYTRNEDESKWAEDWELAAIADQLPGNVNELLIEPIAAWDMRYANLEPILALCNSVLHCKCTDAVRYKKRNPFCDVESMIQLYMDAWNLWRHFNRFHKLVLDDPWRLDDIVYEYFKYRLPEADE